MWMLPEARDMQSVLFSCAFSIGRWLRRITLVAWFIRGPACITNVHKLIQRIEPKRSAQAQSQNRKYPAQQMTNQPTCPLPACAATQRFPVLFPSWQQTAKGLALIIRKLLRYINWLAGFRMLRIGIFH